VNWKLHRGGSWNLEQLSESSALLSASKQPSFFLGEWYGKFCIICTFCITCYATSFLSLLQTHSLQRCAYAFQAFCSFYSVALIELIFEDMNVCLQNESLHNCALLYRGNNNNACCIRKLLMILVLCMVDLKNGLVLFKSKILISSKLKSNILLTFIDYKAVFLPEHF